jgi:hypothetical protein
MPTKTTKPKPNTTYVAVISWVGNDVNVAQGLRLRGDNPIVEKFFDRFVPESTPDDEVSARRAELNAPAPPPEPIGRVKMRIRKGPEQTYGEPKAHVGGRALYEGDTFEAEGKDAQYLLDVGVGEILESLPKRLAKAGAAIANGKEVE